MRHARPDYERFQDPAGLIPEDEPVMLFRGQDEFAPYALDMWVALAEKGGASVEIIAAVRAQAKAMRQWQDACASKIPDMPVSG